ncbi:uncharacterized protein LOC144576585 [Callithrix jacchus]
MAGATSRGPRRQWKNGSSPPHRLRAPGQDCEAQGAGRGIWWNRSGPDGRQGATSAPWHLCRARAAAAASPSRGIPDLRGRRQSSPHPRDRAGPRPASPRTQELPKVSHAPACVLRVLPAGPEASSRRCCPHRSSSPQRGSARSNSALWRAPLRAAAPTGQETE